MADELLPVDTRTGPVPAGGLDVSVRRNHDEDALAWFLANKAQRSARTADSYRRELARFRAFAPKPFAHVRQSDLQAYLAQRHLEGASKPASQAKIAAVLRSFFHFALNLGYIELNPAALLETERVTSDTERRWGTANELRRVIRGAQLGEDFRAALLCRFLAETGLRISEAASVRWGDFFTDPYGNVALRVVGKGTKVRSIQLRPARSGRASRATAS